MRRPVNIPPARIGHGDAEHAARDVGPAQDYPCPIGTPVVAAFDTVRLVQWGSRSADGGLALTGYAENGDSWTVQHLSARLALRQAGEGEHVAFSGNTGRKTTGAHVHSYFIIDGVRINPENAIARAHPAPAVIPPAPIPAPIPIIPEDDDMVPKIIHRNEGADEWSLIHPDLRGPSDLEEGYLVTADETVAKTWARLYGNGWAAALVGPDGRYTADLNRADYIAAQLQARAVYTGRKRAIAERGA